MTLVYGGYLHYTDIKKFFKIHVREPFPPPHKEKKKKKKKKKKMAMVLTKI